MLIINFANVLNFIAFCFYYKTFISYIFVYHYMNLWYLRWNSSHKYFT